MKTIIRNSTYEKVLKMKKQKSYNPIKPSMFWRCLIRLISIPGLMAAKFTYKKINI